MQVNRTTLSIAMISLVLLVQAHVDKVVQKKAEVLLLVTRIQALIHLDQVDAVKEAATADPSAVETLAHLLASAQLSNLDRDDKDLRTTTTSPPTMNRQARAPPHRDAHPRTPQSLSIIPAAMLGRQTTRKSGMRARPPQVRAESPHRLENLRGVRHPAADAHQGLPVT